MLSLHYLQCVKINTILRLLLYFEGTTCNMIAPTNQQDLVSVATSGISGETLISRNVWNNKDINMMIFEEDIASRKRDNKNYTYSNKLKKTIVS